MNVAGVNVAACGHGDDRVALELVGVEEGGGEGERRLLVQRRS